MLGNQLNHQTELQSFGFPKLKFKYKDEGVKNMQRKELPKVNYDEFIGEKTQIENAEVIETRFGLALKVESKPLDEAGIVKASALFSFSKEKDEEGKESYYIGVGTRLDNFMRAKSLTEDMLPETVEVGMTLPVFENVDVVVQKNTRTGYLEII